LISPPTTAQSTSPNAQFVIVKETFQKKKSERELHVALVDGEHRYFIVCGTPLVRQ
jgi:hypothetical protein